MLKLLFKHPRLLGCIAWLGAMLVVVSVTAQVPMTGAGVGAPGGGAASYTGPGDIDTFTAWWGLRAYSSATRGNNLIEVCNSGDANCVNMASSASTGDLVVTSVGSTDCSVSTCTIKTAYDQSGNSRNMSQATEANRFVLTPNVVGSFWGMTSTISSASVMGTGSVAWASDTYPWYVVSKRSGSFTTQQNIISCNNNPVMYYYTSADTVNAYAGNPGGTAAATDSSFHALALNQAGFATLYVDQSGTGLGNIFSSPCSFSSDASMQISSSASPVEGVILEAGTGAPAGSITSIQSNQQSYWGIP